MRVTRPHPRGLTLIELLVALVVGLVLMAGALQLFSANKRTYQMSQEMSRMREGANYALYLLERDVRMAGYLGCTGRNPSNILINNLLTATGGADFTPENGVEGWEANGTANGSYTVIDDAQVADASGQGWSTAGAVAPVLDSGTFSVTNSDVLRIWHVDGNGAIANVAGQSVTATTTPDFAANDILMLTDCNSVDIAKVCSLSSNTASLNCAENAAVSLFSRSGGHAFKLIGSVYYIGKRGGVASNPPALFRRNISANVTAGTPQELVEGVESLQITYGEDTDVADPDGVADRYVSANNVNDWTYVVSIRVALLMQSQSTNIVDGTQTVAFNGTNITTNDGRLRYPFLATISVRNRSL